nr:virulence factor [Pseudopedobacter sp.]
MKKTMLLITSILLIVSSSYASRNTIDNISYGVFGKVKVYHPSINPKAFVIFISGDGGWNLEVVHMANKLVEQGAIVVGVDIRHLLKVINKKNVKCYYPASDFENLSLALQKKYHGKQYFKPILVGLSSGATLAYGLLAQAPANTFKGVIALGFCPDLHINKELCNGEGLISRVLNKNKSFYLEPSKKLKAPFVILQGENDQVCSIIEIKKFVEGMPSTELISLSKLGHSFSVEKNWTSQFVFAFEKILKTPSFIEKVKEEQNQHKNSAAENHFLNEDLPLAILPTKENNNLPLAFVISGDGGWTSFDETFAEKLSENGIPVIGLDAQQYFWDKKSPNETTTMVAKVVSYYMEKWNKSSFILIGYSFGASIIPFVNNRLANPLRENIKGVYCLSPEETADFEIHLSDMLSLGGKEEYNVLGELEKTKNVKPVCFFGEEEEGINLAHYTANGAKVMRLPGGHHYEGSYPIILKTILGTLKNNSYK